MIRQSLFPLAAALCIAAAGQTRLAEPVIQAVVDKIKDRIASREIAGAVTLVVDRTSVRHLSAEGLQDIAAGTPMRPDTLFWIASMTKPITGVAVMMMVDEGRLSLDDPVSRHIPEFAGLLDASGQRVKVTVRQLLTHTSGLGELTGSQWKECRTLADTIPYVVAHPVLFPPGTQWSYCQSGINTAARIVEVLSGQSFPEFLEKRLFGPLGMRDTTFYLRRDQLPRLAAAYSRNADGQLVEAQNFLLMGRAPDSTDRLPAANGGLFSTAPDYGRFCQMLLNSGSFRGRQLLTPEAVRTLRSVHSGSLATGFTSGNGWGIGVCVVREPQGVTAMLSPGSFGHGGAFGTQAWIDPVKGLAYILMVQRADFPNADASDVRREFQETAAAALAR